MDAALERRVLERVQRLVEETQAAYGESVEDDEQLLDNSTESGEVWFQKQNAITVRMSEKTVCRGLLNMLKVLLPLFDMNPPALERSFKSRWKTSPLKGYVKDTIMKLVVDETSQWLREKRSKSAAK